MWRSIFTLLLSTSAALAAQQSTAYDALRVVGTQVDRSLVSHVISVTGGDGDPQPERWTVQVADRAAPSGVREIEVADGRVAGQRITGDAGSARRGTIKTARLNLDSSGAFSVASYTAEKSHVNFASANYTLRNNDRSEPVWIVTLNDENRRPIGTIQIGANRGNVMRVEGLFRGTNMAQGREDPVSRSPRGTARVDPEPRDNAELSAADSDETGDESADGEDEGDDVNVVKKEFRRVFRRTKEDATRIFGRVRRSFDDFFYRE